MTARVAKSVMPEFVLNSKSKKIVLQRIQSSNIFM
jgi:hypothetical protein